MKAREVAELLEQQSPTYYALSWDNVGMHIGRADNTIKKILVTLDIDDKSVEYAVSTGVDMIVAHHPLIFKGVKKINEDDIIGRRILTLIENRINCYCMHTNYDCMGMADAAADRMGLSDTEVLSEVIDGEGIGRVGTLDRSYNVRELCEHVKECFGLDRVILYGNENDNVSRIAICPGSGKDEIQNAIAKGAGALISGDISYHYGIDAVAEGINIIDAGHYGTEHIFIEKISDYLKNNTEDIEIICMDINNPQKFI